MDSALRLLFVGDIIGPAGRAAIHALVPTLRQELHLDAVIANGENSADNGFGITEQGIAELLSVVDFLTLGDHAFDQPEIGPALDREPRIIRPLNFEDTVAGRGWGTFVAGGVLVGVVNVLGRVFMRPKVSSPYAGVDQAIQALVAAGAGPILVDMQAEATSEKAALGWHLAGRVTAVLGTHTHVPTADLRILPGGTAFNSDVGSTGGRDSIIGFSRDDFLRLLVNGERAAPHPSTDAPSKLDAVLIEIDRETNRAIAAERISRETA